MCNPVHGLQGTQCSDGLWRWQHKGGTWRTAKFGAGTVRLSCWNKTVCTKSTAVLPFKLSAKHSRLACW